MSGPRNFLLAPVAFGAWRLGPGQHLGRTDALSCITVLPDYFINSKAAAPTLSRYLSLNKIIFTFDGGQQCGRPKTFFLLMPSIVIFERLMDRTQLATMTPTNITNHRNHLDKGFSLTQPLISLRLSHPTLFLSHSLKSALTPSITKLE